MLTLTHALPHIATDTHKNIHTCSHVISHSTLSYTKRFTCDTHTLSHSQTFSFSLSHTHRNTLSQVLTLRREDLAHCLWLMAALLQQTPPPPIPGPIDPAPQRNGALGAQCLPLGPDLLSWQKPPEFCPGRAGMQGTGYLQLSIISPTTHCYTPTTHLPHTSITPIHTYLPHPHHAFITHTLTIHTTTHPHTCHIHTHIAA